MNLSFLKNSNLLRKVKFAAVSLVSIYAISLGTFIIVEGKRYYYPLLGFHNHAPEKLSLFSVRLSQSISRTIYERSKWSFNKELIKSAWHYIRKDVVPANNYLYSRSETDGIPGGYIEYYSNNQLIGANGKGEMFILSINKEEINIKSLKSNLHEIFLSQDFKGKILPDLQGRFSIRDILLDRESNRILASMYVDINNEGCYGMGIYESFLEPSLAIDKQENLDFKLYFKTKNCNSNFNGHAGGGRMKILNQNVIFTVGSFDVIKQPGANLAELDLSDIGKVYSIDREGKATTLSSGHRNQQGLVIVDNQIFITEHGPQGGDEINLIEPGGHYGWPYYAYGFEYSNKAVYRTKHEGKYKKPLFYFTPSIATSEIIFYDKDEFPYWKDKFIVSSLKDRSLYLLDYDKNNKRILSSEKIDVGERVRDLTTLPDGKIVIITDNKRVLLLSKSSRKRSFKAKQIPF